MERLNPKLSHRWHVAINQYHDNKKHGDWKKFMYEAKTLADEVPRLVLLFEREREGRNPTQHQQCSRSQSVPVVDNHLSCCLGVQCRECPELLALEKIRDVTPEEIDVAKAWTCAAHIVREGGDRSGEGYLMTVDDRMFWDNVYQNMASDPPCS